MERYERGQVYVYEHEKTGRREYECLGYATLVSTQESHFEWTREVVGFEGICQEKDCGQVYQFTVDARYPKMTTRMRCDDCFAKKQQAEIEAALTGEKKPKKEKKGAKITVNPFEPSDRALQRFFDVLRRDAKAKEWWAVDNRNARPIGKLMKEHFDVDKWEVAKIVTDWQADGLVEIQRRPNANRKMVQCVIPVEK